MNRFRNMTLNSDLNSVISKANELFFPGSPMMHELYFKNDFKYDSGAGSEIVNKIYNCKKVVKVYFYKSKNPWSKAVGYFDGVNIHINSRKFSSLSEVDLLGLLCHEYCHACGFGHGNNYKTKEKVLYSVPYFVSENIKKWV